MDVFCFGILTAAFEPVAVVFGLIVSVAIPIASNSSHANFVAVVSADLISVLAAFSPIFKDEPAFPAILSASSDVAVNLLTDVSADLISVLKPNSPISNASAPLIPILLPNLIAPLTANWIKPNPPSRTAEKASNIIYMLNIVDNFSTASAMSCKNFSMRCISSRIATI